jgi:subfamily B ATP-binding cassette protein MsbA
MDDFRKLFPFIRPHFAELGFSLILLAFAGGFEVLTTALAIPLFDKVLPVTAVSHSVDRFRFLEQSLALLPGSAATQLAIALVTLTLLKGVCLYYSNFLMNAAGQRVVTELRDTLYAHVMGQSLGFFAHHPTGRLMSRMSSDVDQVQEAVSTTLGELFREAILLVALMAWIFYVDWRLAVLSLVIAPVALLLSLTMGRRVRRASWKGREQVAGLADLLQQTISGIRIVKAFGMEQHEERRFRAASARLFAVNLRAAGILFLNSPVMELAGVLAFVPLLFYAERRIAAGTLSLGVFGGSLFSLFRMYDPIRKLSRIHIQFQRAFASASRIFELLETSLAIQDRPGARVLHGLRDGIEFDEVSFSYGDPSSPADVLRGIRLEVRRGEVVALVGPSGAGKTTLVNLIPRFYDVTRGAIRIDGVDLRDFTQASLRRNISVVTQETFLFNGTIHENIAYGEPDASEERIEGAARAALAHEFVQRLPMRYETRIGERGQRLSGGERQRISIARAILKDAPILVLDEATSALDSESEKLVQQALLNLMVDRTTFVIAHRLSTVRRATRIVVLDGGVIREMGTHDELLERGGIYSHLFRMQFASSTDLERPAASTTVL